MAAQLAVLLGGRLEVPVRMREVDAERAAAGRHRVATSSTAQVRRGRTSARTPPTAARRITVGTDLADLAGADLVVEAVTEVLDVKRAVFAELEDVVGPDAVLATNTSALSVDGDGRGAAPARTRGRAALLQPRRPDAAGRGRARRAHLPTPRSPPPFAVAARRGQDRGDRRPTARGSSSTASCCASWRRCCTRSRPARPSRSPTRRCARSGCRWDRSPCSSSSACPVALHVLEHLHDDLGERLPAVTGAGGRSSAAGRAGGARAGRLRPRGGRRPGDPGRLRRAGRPSALTSRGVLDAVLAGLAQEVGLMLDEGVVVSPEQIDLAMILGAGFPFHLGGSAALPRPLGPVAAGARAAAPARARPAQTTTRPLARSWCAPAP